MSDQSSLRQYAQAYRRLAEIHPNPELRTLLVRMAEVWTALAAHTDRIAARRAAAESMPDVPLAPNPEGYTSGRVPIPRREYID
jgi:hypothetical protein